MKLTRAATEKGDICRSTSQPKSNFSTNASAIEVTSSDPKPNNAQKITDGSLHTDIGIQRSTWFDTSAPPVLDKMQLSIEVNNENISNPKHVKRRISF